MNDYQARLETYLLNYLLNPLSTKRLTPDLLSIVTLLKIEQSPGESQSE